MIYEIISICLPLFSDLAASSSPAQAAAHEEMPTKMPSSLPIPGLDDVR